jgi:hypothetical protein
MGLHNLLKRTKDASPMVPALGYTAVLTLVNLAVGFSQSNMVVVGAQNGIVNHPTVAVGDTALRHRDMVSRRRLARRRLPPRPHADPRRHHRGPHRQDGADAFRRRRDVRGCRRAVRTAPARDHNGAGVRRYRRTRTLVDAPRAANSSITEYATVSMILRGAAELAGKEHVRSGRQISIY